MRLSKPYHVALLIGTSRAYGRGLLLGVANYIRDNGPWIISRQEQKFIDEIPEWFKTWKGDGILFHMENPDLIKFIRQRRIPAVQFHGVSTEAKLNFPAILSNNDSVAKTAFDHLRERGFRHFAFCGVNGASYSDSRRDAFVRQVGKNGLQSHVYINAWQLGLENPQAGYQGQKTLAMGYQGQKNRERIVNWIKTLPKPVGLMACNDMRAEQVLEACQIAGVKVPDEVAVVGVDNDEVFCDFSNPPLTSVVPNTKRIGYQAAALLDRMMAGNKVPPHPVYVEPLGIVTRRSTDILAIEDRQIAVAASFIRERACEGISVKDVAKAAGLSDRTMERRFTKILGHSPKEEVLRVRLGRAKQLLAETDFSLTWIAEKIGLEHTEYISRIFKKKTGLTPGEFRSRSRAAIKADKLPT